VKSCGKDKSAATQT